MFLNFNCAQLVLIFVFLIVSTGAKNYSVVLVGGGLLDDNDEIWNKIVELGGGKGIAKFGVVSAASGDPCCDKDSSFYYYSEQLLSYGALEVNYIPITVDSTENNMSPIVADKIKAMSGFMFGGGDQSRIIESFYNDGTGHAKEPKDKNRKHMHYLPSMALNAIKETLLATGGVIAGTSAGTDCQTSSVMITGGESLTGLNYISSIFYNTVSDANSMGVSGYGLGGLGHFGYGLLDTHFENRGRQGRLLRLLSDTRMLPMGSQYAFGVDENTALVVSGDWNDRIGTIIGERGVMLFDITRAAVDVNMNNSTNWSIFGAHLSHMTRGDVIRFATYDITAAAYKRPIPQEEQTAHAETSLDIFEEDTFEFNRIAVSLYNSVDQDTYGLTRVTRKDASDLKQYNVTMHRCDSIGYSGTDPVTNISSTSYTNMCVDMSPA